MDNFLPNLVQNNENKHPQKSKMAKLKQHVLTRFQTFHFTTRSLQATQESLNNKQTFHMWVYRDENANNTFTVGEWRHAIYMLDFKTHPDFMRPSVALFFSGGGSKFSSDSSEESLDVDGAEFGLLTSRLSSFRNR